MLPLLFRPRNGGGGEGWLVALSSDSDRIWPPGPPEDVPGKADEWCCWLASLNEVTIRVDRASSQDGGATRGCNAIGYHQQQLNVAIFSILIFESTLNSCFLNSLNTLLST